ncbi:isocitrate lyase/phosphoenolpyruvate mutase family protein [Listeria weihenstephanensis]|uniref:Isocitrate lyase/phosphoenolpyruvate mutase family protein n=1 Tax=Listeria weihenstephanensis TaxID=1006155 RepID=A0A841Z825_9LIST|nr:isocitrate lyase/phosphoenolpyruvate mutase family protein [Listeria weihenstephanensis]MBC1501019.1 isocitrate lyase/phosphoenolpyruvate mutase family protein [Listeria weihenstephanensis]
MDLYTQFKEPHFQKEPLILYNIWDIASMKAVENAGAKAIATSSFAIAQAWGYNDGETLPLDQNLWFLNQIRQNTSLPLNLDIESAYSNSLDTLAENIQRFLQLDAQGINFEDRKEHTLWSIEQQAARIQTIRATATKLHKDIFINARTDIFFQETMHTTDLVKRALERADAYKEAGADCIFIPGLTDLDLISIFTEKSPLPVNIMTSYEPSLFKNIGVARISCGPTAFLNIQGQLETNAKKMMRS